jgi:LysM repeat protein
VVGKGDSLSVIAKRFGVSKAEIMLLNNISDPNRIRLGQKLKMPASADLSNPRPVTTKASSASPSAAPASTVNATTAPVSGSTGDYVVKSGDSLSLIAQRNGTTVKALKETNNLKNDKIVVGQKLVLPTGTATPVTVPSLAEPTAPVAPVVEDAAAMMAAPVEPVITTPDLNALPPEQPPVPAGARTTHSVKVGDTILTVASEYNVSISKLRKANNLTSDTLVPGRILVIPAAD